MVDRQSPERLKRRSPIWKLEDAKARFSEVVRRARTEGPQEVTVRGEPAVIVVAKRDYVLRGTPPSLIDALLQMPRNDDFADIIDRVVAERRNDNGRDIEL